jgi:hypothetical protein
MENNWKNISHSFFVVPFGECSFFNFILFCKSDNYLLKKQILLMQKPFYPEFFSKSFGLKLEKILPWNIWLLLSTWKQHFAFRSVAEPKAHGTGPWPLSINSNSLGFIDRQWKRLSTSVSQFMVHALIHMCQGW